MHILVIENFANTTLGLVGDALDEAGATTETRVVHGEDGVAVPEGADGFDALVVLGGAQSAVDDEKHPELPSVVRLIRQFGDADKAVLGICLGSQLIARAYGATNILARPIEFGWHAVSPTPGGKLDPVIAPLGEGAPVFHWHTDTFSLPPGAEHLATSAMTPHQAFRVGRAVYGIQFHFEASRAVVDEWSTVFADHIDEIVSGWPTRREEESASRGVIADAVGLEIARRWVERIR